MLSAVLGGSGRLLKLSFPVIFLLTLSGGRLRNTRLRVAVCLSLRVPGPCDEVPWYARGAEKVVVNWLPFSKSQGVPEQRSIVVCTL